MRYLPYILTGVFMTATAVQTIYIHDTNVLLDAKDSYIARLNDNVSYWKETSIENSNSAAFQRERCDAFYDVVGDYIEVSKEIDARRLITK